MLFFLIVKCVVSVIGVYQCILKYFIIIGDIIIIL